MLIPDPKRARALLRLEELWVSPGGASYPEVGKLSRTCCAKGDVTEPSCSAPRRSDMRFDCPAVTQFSRAFETHKTFVIENGTVQHFQGLPSLSTGLVAQGTRPMRSQGVWLLLIGASTSGRWLRLRVITTSLVR